MIASRFDIVRKLHEYWPLLVDGRPPGLTNIAMADNRYWLPSKSALVRVVTDTFMDRYRYVVAGMDCDDFAQILHSFIVQERYREMMHRGSNKKEWLPWAFGQCWGQKFQGKDGGHAINLCVTRDSGIMLIEPQNDALWEAKKGEDFVFFIRI